MSTKKHFAQLIAAIQVISLFVFIMQPVVLLLPTAAEAALVGDPIIYGSGVSANSDSTAMGCNTNASGAYSTAMGLYTNATGYAATAMGWCTNASNTASTAMGGYTNASGWYSTAMGWYTNASGWASVAMGQSSYAKGDNSFAMGNGANASKKNAIAIGGNAQATAQNAIAFGQGSEAAAEDSFALGGTIASGHTGSVALGSGSCTSGTYEVSVGSSTQKRKITNVADGVADSDVATVGQLKSAGAPEYIAASKYNGTGANASAVSSGATSGGGTAIGYGSNATANYATAIGYGASATHENSVAIGKGSCTSETNEFSVGSSIQTRKISNVTAVTPAKNGTYAATTGQIYDATLTQGSVSGSSVTLKNAEGTALATVDMSGLTTTQGNTLESYFETGTGVAKEATKATQDGNGAVIADTYATKTDVASTYVTKTDAASTYATKTDIAAKANAADVTAALATKADISTVTALDTRVTAAESAISGKADKSYVDTELGKKQDSLSAAQLDAVNSGITAAKIAQYDGYDARISGSETALTNKADKATSLSGYGITDAYTKTQTDSAITTAVNNEATARDTAITAAVATKADKATSLSGYGITDAYTKTAVDTEVTRLDGRIDGIVAGQSELIAGRRVQTSDTAATSGGAGAVASGYNSNAASDKSVATGYNSAVSQPSTSGIAIGDGATVGYGKDGSITAAINSVAIGVGSRVTGENSIAVGTGHIVSGNNSGAFGDPNIVSGSGSYAIGNNNTIAHDNSFVLGSNVTTTQANSVVLGAGSTDRAATAGVGVVSVGAQGKERQIINVAPGEVSATSTDAVNGSQLYSAYQAIEKITNEGINRMSQQLAETGKEVKEVGAISAALAGLHYVEPSGEEGDKFVAAAAYGGYRGESAAALGVAYKPSTNLMLSASTSVGQTQNAYNAGVSYKFGKGSTAATRASLQKQVKYLNERNSKLEEENREQNAKIEQQSTENAQLKQELNELKEAVKELKKRIKK